MTTLSLDSKNVCDVQERFVSLPQHLNAKTNTLISSFAQKLMAKGQSAGLYEEERNAAPGNIERNIMTGKKGEVFALVCLREQFNFPEGCIDIGIRNGAQKGWIEDIRFKEPGYPVFHVKTCDGYSNDLIGKISWVFQLENKISGGGRDPLFDGPDDAKVILVYIEEWSMNTATIKAIVSWGNHQETSPTSST